MAWERPPRSLLALVAWPSVVHRPVRPLGSACALAALDLAAALHPPAPALAARRSGGIPKPQPAHRPPRATWEPPNAMSLRAPGADAAQRAASPTFLFCCPGRRRWVMLRPRGCNSSAPSCKLR